MPSSRARTRDRSPRAYFSSVAVMVSDRAKSLEWYTRRLGLEIVELDPNDPHWVVVGGKGRTDGLHLCQAGDYPDLVLEPGNSGVDLRIDTGLKRACAVWRRRGIEFAVPPTKRSWGWEAQVRDPDGNILRITPPLNR